MMGATVNVEGFEVPTPGKIHKGQHVTFGEVQFAKRSWYLVPTCAGPR
jgi:hypothetical protein